MSNNNTSSPNNKRKADGSDTPKRLLRRKITEGPEYGVEPVKVQVGQDENQKTFFVHKDLLIKHSEFFRAALSEPWKEAEERAVTLPCDEPEIFSIFCRFLYTGQIFSIKDGDYKMTPVPEAPNRHRDAEWGRLPDAWILGEKLLSTSFKDATVDAIIAKVVDRNAWPTAMQEDIYPKSSGSSKIRKLLVDIAAWEWTEDSMSRREQGQEWAQFYFDLSTTLIKINREGTKREAPYKGEDTCIYHEHGEEQPCYKTMF